MPILGIDYEKRINCGACITLCPAKLFSNGEENDRVVFQDLNRMCISCGHCFAGCPENAVLQKGIGESYSFDGVEKPESIVTYGSLYNLLQAHRSIRRKTEAT